MVLLEIIKAFCLGICAAVPPGPVAILVLQKTLTRGRGAGVVTGMGSMTVDTVYAGLSFFAIGMILDVISRYENIILLVGGVIVALVGWSMAVKRPVVDFEGNSRSKTSVGYAIQCAGCALANPGALAMILTIVALVGLNTETVTLPIWALLPFVAAGEFSYWLLYTWLADKLRRAVTSNSLMWINRIAGVAVIVLGVVLAIRGIIML